MKGLGYVKVRDDLTFDGPIDKFLKRATVKSLSAVTVQKQAM